MVARHRSGRSRPRTKNQIKVPKKERELRRALETVRKEINQTYNTKQTARRKYDRAKAKMQQAFEQREVAYAHHSEVWAEFGLLRDASEARIAVLREEADAEHQSMQICFHHSHDARDRGDKSEAPLWILEALDHRDRRDRCNSEIAELNRAIEAAKAQAQNEAPRVESTALELAKSECQSAKSDYEALQAKLRDLQAERDRLQEELRCAQIERLKAQDQA